ncbi:hypothetical protein [Sporolituus thermophilus]|uniref:Uncharacterized protein n=1 Tax=Sporolituus thermophilus DSM 23256 TaxID=1123285 RepID=A0A1G7JAS6_9FIRM|nr:hypothetical protein [Sporolituus thermophilus]SDF21986.1 hypothetical protein SAMN05660235_00855 [Sporolituus thermophilus DSM 23256]
MLGMNKEQLLQVAGQTMQTTHDVTAAVAEMIEANNKLLTQQIEDYLHAKRTKNHRFDLM